MLFVIWDLGFRIWDLEFGIWNLKFCGTTIQYRFAVTHSIQTDTPGKSSYSDKVLWIIRKPKNA